jgi:hypothetical protein
VEVLYEIAEAIQRFMDSSPGLLVELLLILIASVPLVLIHELGHAVVARRLIGGDVQVAIGDTGRLAELQLGQISLTLNALSRPGNVAGVAEFDDSRATARDIVWIALAGPAASLVGTVLSALAFSAVAPSGVLHDFLWAMTFGGVFGVANIVPLTIEERRNGRVVRTDGRLALDALRVLWDLR